MQRVSPYFTASSPLNLSFFRAFLKTIYHNLKKLEGEKKNAIMVRAPSQINIMTLLSTATQKHQEYAFQCTSRAKNLSLLQPLKIIRYSAHNQQYLLNYAMIGTDNYIPEAGRVSCCPGGSTRLTPAPTGTLENGQGDEVIKC